jgi:predicted transcriptional regulator
MIDFNGETAKAYQVNDKSPVVVVIDRGGVLRAVEKKPHGKDTFAGITEAIDKALESPPAK